MPKLTPKEMGQARKEFHKHKCKFHFVKMMIDIKITKKNKRIAEFICDECGKLKEVEVRENEN